MSKQQRTGRGPGARPGAGAGPIESLPEGVITVDRTPPIWERYEEEPLLDIVEVADYLEFSVQTVFELFETGHFPAPLMYEGKKRWSIAAIADWAKAWPEKKRRLDREWGLPLEGLQAERGGGMVGLASDRAPQSNRVVMRLYDRASGVRRSHSVSDRSGSSSDEHAHKEREA